MAERPCWVWHAAARSLALVVQQAAWFSKREEVKRSCRLGELSMLCAVVVNGKWRGGGRGSTVRYNKRARLRLLRRAW